MAIANSEGPSVVYGGSGHGNQQQRIAGSTDVNNNEVTISTTGTFLKIILTRECQVWPRAKFIKNSQISFCKILETNSTIWKYRQRGLI